MITKLSILKSHMAAGDWIEALRLAAKFHNLGKHRREITTAWSAHTNASFYTQINKDPKALINTGIEALKARYDSPSSSDSISATST